MRQKTKLTGPNSNRVASAASEIFRIIGTFTLEAADDSGVLMWTGKGGSKAVVLFPSQEAAEAFIGQQCNVVKLRVVELTPESIDAWAAKVRRYDAQAAILNPTSDSDLTQRNTAGLDALVRTILGNHSDN